MPLKMPLNKEPSPCIRDTCKGREVSAHFAAACWSVMRHWELSHSPRMSCDPLRPVEMPQLPPYLNTFRATIRLIGTLELIRTKRAYALHNNTNATCHIHRGHSHAWRGTNCGCSAPARPLTDRPPAASVSTTTGKSIGQHNTPTHNTHQLNHNQSPHHEHGTEVIVDKQVSRCVHVPNQQNIQPPHLIRNRRLLH